MMTSVSKAPVIRGPGIRFNYDALVSVRHDVAKLYVACGITAATRVVELPINVATDALRRLSRIFQRSHGSERSPECTCERFQVMEEAGVVGGYNV